MRSSPCGCSPPRPIGVAGPRVWLATKGALPVEGSSSRGARWQAPLWGAGRVFALEHPSRWGGLVDVAPERPDDSVAETIAGRDRCATMARIRRPGDPAVDLRRACRRRIAVIVRRRCELRPDATYLVTGGFGGLGLLVARWMAEQGATSIALLGRTPDPTSAGGSRDRSHRRPRVRAGRRRRRRSGDAAAARAARRRCAAFARHRACSGGPERCSHLGAAAARRSRACCGRRSTAR